MSVYRVGFGSKGPDVLVCILYPSQECTFYFLQQQAFDSWQGSLARVERLCCKPVVKIRAHLPIETEIRKYTTFLLITGIIINGLTIKFNPTSIR